MDAATSHVIIINPAARRVVQTSPDVLAEQLPFLTVAAELVQDVHLVVIATLRTGVLITEHAMVTVAKTVLGIHVMNVAAAQDVLPVEAPAGVLRAVLVHLIPAVTDKTELYYPVRPDTGYVPQFPLAPA